MSKQETKADFKHFLTIPTRWMDNDIYGHVNNVIYYSYIDTVANEYLIHHGGLDIHHDSVIAVAVESQCKYFRPIVFPDSIEAGLRVGHLGNTSVRYEIGLFNACEDTLCASAYFVHVFVRRESYKPVPIPGKLRRALSKISIA